VVSKKPLATSQVDSINFLAEKGTLSGEDVKAGLEKAWAEVKTAYQDVASKFK